VALSGDGGDEAFGGYRRYMWANLAARLTSLPRPLPFLVRKTLEFLPGPGQHAIRDFGARLGQDEAARYLGLICHFTFEDRTALYGPALRGQLATDAAYDQFRRRLADSTARDDVSRFCELDAHTYLPEDIFFKVDIASMTHSLEARAPFVDHRVMELGAALPGRLKLRDRKGKYILKKAFADKVPEEIRERRKKGFASPMRNWFAGPLRGFAHDLLLSPEARGRGLFKPEAVEQLLDRHQAGEDCGERIWNLVILEQWHREFVDGRQHFMREVDTLARTLARDEGPL
jgi:asparagine synthase (glutamine-hydrolysing)